MVTELVLMCEAGLGRRILLAYKSERIHFKVFLSQSSDTCSLVTCAEKSRGNAYI